MKNREIINGAIKIETLNDMIKMWMWLYKHPAHDQNYYVSYVAHLDRPWKNNCAGTTHQGKDRCSLRQSCSTSAQALLFDHFS